MPFRLTRSLLPLALSLLAFTGLLAAGPARAAILTVTTNADSGTGSLRAALTQAKADTNDTIVFQMGLPSTITLTSGALPTITQNLTIQGPVGGIAVDGGGQFRVFGITGGMVNFSGLTIQNGRAPANEGTPFSGQGGGVAISGGTVTLMGCTLSGNSTSNGDGFGGAVYNQATATLTGCTLSGNSAQFGGAVDNQSGTVTLTGCTLSGNNTSGGFGGDAGGAVDNTGGLVTLTGCTLTGNSTSGVGGAVDNYQGYEKLTDCTLSGNSALLGGAVGSLGTLTLTGCTFSGNRASSGGGAVYTSAGNMLLAACTLSGNSAPSGQGGAVYNQGGIASLTDNVLYGDTGGEVVNESGNGGTVTEKYCDDQGNASATPDANHDFGADPLFVRASGTNGATDYGDLHLEAGSPCISAGITANGVTTDRDGNLYFTPPAVGAYEGPRDVASDTHVLWDNPDGKTIFWDVNAQGAHLIAGTYGPFQDDANGPSYTAVSLSTGPDGVSHLLWTNPDGDTYLWTVNTDGTYTPFLYGPFEDDGTSSTIWKAVAVSTGGDNVTHVLWTNPNGRTVLWDVSGDGSFAVVGNYDGFSDDGTANMVWKAGALASGPDGLSHVLWSNPDGKTLLWNLDAQHQPTPFTYGPFSDDGTSSTLWSARALSVGPDNVPHLLWNNPNQRTILWDVASDGTFTIPGNYNAFADSAQPNTAYTAVSLATGGDGLSHFAWDNPDGSTYLWSVSSTDGSHTDVFYPPFLDDGTPSTTWKAVAVSAGVPTLAP